jgi:MFS transporter, PAT family, beta-lactamase induction signal transducer AmpG
MDLISRSTRRTSIAETLAVYLQRRVLIVMFLGFSSGLPLALSGSTLLIWMRESGVNLGTIGLFALVGTPYTVKFAWAPLIDALDVPILSRLLGRRRGWLVLAQLLLMAAIVFLAFCDPSRSAFVVALGALLVATASATQDIVVDAFRVESLSENEQAAGMASYVAAYRIGTLASTAGALFIVSIFQGAGLEHQAAWTGSYVVMAVLVLIGIGTTLVAVEPEKSLLVRAVHAKESSLQRVAEAAIGAFSEFLSRDMAVVALAFVVLFKFTDALSGTMTAPFVIDLGFSRNEYAAIIKGVGLAATLIGGFAGGFVARAYSLPASLMIGGLLQAFANLAFSWQAVVGLNAAWLTFAIIAENFTSAIGTVIFVAYLSALCRNPLHTATQYALLTALAAFGRTYLSAGAGFIAAATGWVWFFAICALAGLPALVLLAWLQRRGHFDGLGPATAPAPKEASAPAKESAATS